MDSTNTQALSEDCGECDKCFKVVKEVFETSNSDYVCQDCMESMNDAFENLRDDMEVEA